MLPPRSTTRLTGSGWVAGPWRTAPVRLSKIEPWHGHSSAPAWYSTRQPAWVQIAEHALRLPSAWRTTMSAWPSAGSG